MQSKMKFRTRHIYLVFCVLGILLPYYQIIGYTNEYGMDYAPLFTDIFMKTSTAFFAYDLLVAAFVALLFMYMEAKRINMKKFWIPMTCVVGIGFAFGLPLFLYMRQKMLDKD